MTESEAQAKAREIADQYADFRDRTPLHVLITAALLETAAKHDAQGYRRGVTESAKVADSERKSEEEWMHHYIQMNDTARHFKAMGGAAAALDIARDIRALLKSDAKESPRIDPERLKDRLGPSIVELLEGAEHEAVIVPHTPNERRKK